MSETVIAPENYSTATVGDRIWVPRMTDAPCVILAVKELHNGNRRFSVHAENTPKRVFFYVMDYCA